MAPACGGLGGNEVLIIALLIYPVGNFYHNNFIIDITGIVML